MNSFTRWINSIYIQLFMACCLAFVPIGGVFLWYDLKTLNTMLDDKVMHRFSAMQTSLQYRLDKPADLVREFEAEAVQLMRMYTKGSGGEVLFTKIELLQRTFVDRQAGRFEYRRSAEVVEDHSFATATPATQSYGGDDFQKLKPNGKDSWIYAFPYLVNDSPDYAVILHAAQPGRESFLYDVLGRKAGLMGFSFFLVYLLVALAVHFVIKRPMKLMLDSVNPNKAARITNPDELGEFAEIARAVLAERQRMRDTVDSARQADPVTGLPSEAAFVPAWQAAAAEPKESYVVFFKVKHAKEYVMTFGRVYRDIIGKITAKALTAALPRGSKLYLNPDNYFLAVLKPAELEEIVTQAQRKFSSEVLILYEEAQGKKVPIQALAAFAVSTRLKNVQKFEELAEKVSRAWSQTLLGAESGWVLLDSDGNLHDPSGESKALEIQGPENPLEESTMDPALERKIFIIKLCRFTGVKPKLAAQVYSSGWRRLKQLARANASDLAARAGVTQDEAGQIIEPLKQAKPDDLQFHEDDLRDVFVTDVRRIRKIPKESVLRWYEAGFKQIADLKSAEAPALHELDSVVPLEDIEFILNAVQGEKVGS